MCDMQSSSYGHIIQLTSAKRRRKMPTPLGAYRPNRRSRYPLLDPLNGHKAVELPNQRPQLLLRNFGRPASPMAHGARPSNSQKRIVKVAPGISPAAGTMPAAGSGMPWTPWACWTRWSGRGSRWGARGGGGEGLGHGGDQLDDGLWDVHPYWSQCTCLLAKIQ